MLVMNSVTYCSMQFSLSLFLVPVSGLMETSIHLMLLLGQACWYLLVYCLRFLERVVSTMKNIKVDKWSSMSNELSDDLLVINVNIEEFKPDHSIDLWWSSKTRRPNQTARKIYEKRKVVQGTSSTKWSLELRRKLSNCLNTARSSQHHSLHQPALGSKKQNHILHKL